MAFLRSAWTQWFPPAPAFTEKDVPSQSGKVFVVTGGNSGIGYELIKILYAKGALVYMASRSQAKATAAIEAIKDSDANQSATGQLKYLRLDLDDLNSVKAAAASFASQESKLDVLWNNAGVATVPIGSTTKQNLEQHMGVNCVAPFLFTKLLLPQLQVAAKSAPEHSVRIVWTSSWMTEGMAPRGGIDFGELEKGGSKDPNRDYAASKAGNWFLAVEFARRFGADGILSVVQNPGNLVSNVWQHQTRVAMMVYNLVLHETKLGAYTELFAGLSEEITAAENGSYIIPWGRLRKTSPRADIVKALRDEGEGGMTGARRFWDWCEEQTKHYV